MELHYRGAVYQTSEKAIEMTDDIIGHYRGAEYHVRRPKQPVQQKRHLKYRGAWVD
jgi:hypothetical protein